MFRRRLRLPLAALLLGVSCASGAEDEYWFLGIWEKVHDDNRSAPYEMVGFREDGTFIDYGGACRDRLGTFQVRNRTIVVAPPAQGAIAAAFVLVPSEDRTSLTRSVEGTPAKATFVRAARPLCK